LLVEHPGTDKLPGDERGLVERGVPRPLLNFEELGELEA
jgi:hypothetical protein